MPRAQKVQAAPQDQYGERQALEQAQAQQPLPQADPMAEAAAMPPVNGILNQPVDKSLPPTSGLPMGPGANTVQPTQRAKMKQADVLRLAAQLSNNPNLAQLADRITAGGPRPMPRNTGGTVIRDRNI